MLTTLATKYRLEVYRQLAALVEKAGRGFGDAFARSGAAISEMKMNLSILKMGVQPGLSSRRGKDFASIQRDAHRLVIQVVMALEHNELVLPRFRFFRMACHVQLQRSADKFSELFPELLPFLPTDVPTKDENQ